MYRSRLPSHYTDREHILDAFRSELFAEELREIPQQARTCRDPQMCDERFLDVLAVEFTTDFWNDRLSVQEKRNLLENTIYLKRIKGTVRAVKLVLESLGIEATIKEGMNLAIADGSYVADGIYYAGGGRWSGYVIYAETPVPFWKAELLKEIVEVYAPARSRLFALVYNRLAIADGTYLANGEIAAGTIGVDNV